MLTHQIDKELEQIIAKAAKDTKAPKWLKGFLSFLCRLPFPLGTILAAGLGFDCFKVVCYSIKGKTGEAIETIYFSKNRFWKGPWNIGDAIWRASANVKSVMARGEFVANAIPALIAELLKRSWQQITLVSLGCGSAVKLLQEFPASDFDKTKLKLVLVDKETKPLGLAVANAEKLGVRTASYCLQVGQFLEQTTEQFSIVEMVGLSEYIDDKQLKICYEQIFRHLEPNGFFLGANMSSEQEKEAIHKLIRWPKIFYRPKQQLFGFLKEAGFEKIWLADCGTITVWVAEK